MACGCGGSNGGHGGCGGSSQPAATPVPDESALVAAALAEEVRSEPLLIASSEQEWPRVRVNGVEIPPEELGQELQYHPAESREQAVFLAARALVIRELLRQRIAELRLPLQVQPGESEEEAAIRTLIEQEVALPQADEEACQRFYQQNRARFVSAPLVAARHILLECAPDDLDARHSQRELAEQLLAQLQADPARFAELALQHSACPSKQQGGALGQISKGQTVPEFERPLLRLATGLAGAPLESRYGYHLVWVDQHIDGRELPFEAVREDIRGMLRQGVWQKGVAQYLQTLIGAALIEGIHLQGADSPLLQ